MSKYQQMNPIDALNAIVAKLGLGPQRHKGNDLLYWPIPKDHTGTKYAFGYTPHRTEHNGKTGFFACKYRVLKNGSMRLVKQVRFGRRKIASKRSADWYRKYYGREP